MSDSVIKVDRLAKKYRIRHAQAESYATLRDVVTAKFRRAFDRRQTTAAVEDFWALKDVSFEVKRGEVIGVIGRNGAGKSTLLKLLSRITEPTAGRIELKGRVASLLEVGTGFHPELTGRENIYLNGAILGMKKSDIKSKFDEIVNFSGVERFLDTPVKRYSSGMYVRLAFAIAAYVDSEIVIMDEILAVGDVEFQEKCLGKIGEVVGGGRTVMIVSHNLQTIVSLCNRAIVLDAGRIICDANADVAVSSYLSTDNFGANHVLFHRPTADSGADAAITRVELLDENCRPKTSIAAFDFVRFRLGIKCLQSVPQGSLIIEVRNAHGLTVVKVETNPSAFRPLNSSGDHLIDCCIETLPLMAGRYSLSIGLAVYGVCIMTWHSDVASIVIGNPPDFHQAYGNTGIAAVRHWWVQSEIIPEQSSVNARTEIVV